MIEPLEDYLHFSEEFFSAVYEGEQPVAGSPNQDMKGLTS